MIDCHNHIGVELMGYLRSEFPYAQQLRTLIAEGTPFGLDRWIVFPMVSNLTHDLEAMREGRITQDQRLERIPYAFENRRHLSEIHDLFPDLSGSAIPFVMLDPSREQKAQVEALRELRSEYPITGFKIQSTILQSPIRDLLAEGSVLLDLAEEWDTPLLIHSSVQPNDLWAQAGDILDVVDTRPRLRFCLAHNCRFDRLYLDRIASTPNAWFDSSALRIHCELAVQNSSIVATPERRFESDYARPEQVLSDLAEAYPGKLLWGSDSPYYSFVATHMGQRLSLLSTYELEVSCLHTLPKAVQEDVAENNTIRFLYGETGR